MHSAAGVRTVRSRTRTAAHWWTMMPTVWDRRSRWGTSPATLRTIPPLLKTFNGKANKKECCPQFIPSSCSFALSLTAFLISHTISSASVQSILLPPIIHTMIVDNLPTRKQTEAQLDSSVEPHGTAALEELPPSFEQATEDRLLPEPPHQDPPPAFSTYAASFFTARNGAIVSHDPHLNEDGMCPVTPDQIYCPCSNAAQSR
jgi:hypothetical protein